MLPSTPTPQNSTEDATTESVWPTPPSKSKPAPVQTPILSTESKHPVEIESELAAETEPEVESESEVPKPAKQKKSVGWSESKLPRTKQPGSGRPKPRIAEKPKIVAKKANKQHSAPSKPQPVPQLSKPQPSKPQPAASQLNGQSPVEVAAEKTDGNADVWPETAPEPKWQQDEIIKIDITDLSNTGDGVGRWDNRVVFVPNTVPGDEMRVKLTKVKATYGFGIPAGIVRPSPDRVRPACIVADKCGGCQWQAVSYEAQLAAKHRLVTDAMVRIGKLEDVRVDPVLGAEAQLNYRNKATYPVVMSQIKTVKAGYYRKGSHTVVNLNQCPVQDERLDPLLAEVKQDIQDREWKIYDEHNHKGHIKHLSLRVGQRTGQILLTLVSRSVKLKGIHEQAQAWMERYPAVVGVLVNLNWKKTNAIFGADSYCIAGQPYLEEEFAGLTYQIQPTTFFQVNTTQAERMLVEVQKELALTGEEVVVDAYCGVGTFTLPLAKQAKHCIGIESFTESVTQAEKNAALNGIENVSFTIGDVGATLPNVEMWPDVVMMDPPRKGCEPDVLAALRAMKPQRIVYVSCNPATLARDLKVLCEDGAYRISRIQPADFFPQTSHVECAAFLVAS